MTEQEAIARLKQIKQVMKNYADRHDDVAAKAEAYALVEKIDLAIAELEKR